MPAARAPALSIIGPMRLGTKLLLLTLSLVIGLTVIVLAIVRDRVRDREEKRTPAAIHRAASDYFDRVDAAVANARRVAGLLVRENRIRARLNSLNRTRDDADVAEFRDYLFKLPGQREMGARLVSGDEVPPAFHALFAPGNDLLAWLAPDDPLLDSTIPEHADHWGADNYIDNPGTRPYRYALIRDDLFLLIAIPLSDLTGDTEPPTNVYFVAYRVDARWASGFLRPADNAADAPDVPLSVWFVRRPPAPTIFGGAPLRNAGTTAAAQSIYDTASSLRADDPPAPARLTIAGENILAELAAYEPAPGQRLVLAVTASLDRALEPMNRLLTTITFAGLGVLLVAFAACRWIARRIATPVESLVSATQGIAAGQFDITVDTRRPDELGDLARGLHHMARGLAQRDFIKETFGKFVDPSVVSGILEDPDRLRPGGEQRVQSVLMSDIEGFTSLSEALTPEHVVRLLNAHLGAAADIVTELRGVVDKFIGDAVVAFWGPPLTDDHAPRAALASLRMLRAATDLAPTCRELRIPPLKVRVGIATGPMLVGNIGSASKFNYTVMGDTVNLCSRLEGLNKLYNTSILCTRRTAELLPEGWITREIDVVRVFGRGRPVTLFELLAAPDSPDHDRMAARAAAYSIARALYIRQDWDEARSAFELAVSSDPDDGAASALALRCTALEANPPEPGWDGVWSFGIK